LFVLVRAADNFVRFAELRKNVAPSITQHLSPKRQAIAAPSSLICMGAPRCVLLPAPTSSERRHRSLARRGVASVSSASASFFFRSALATRRLSTSVVAFVVFVRRPVMDVRLFAPLRDKITSLARSIDPCWSPQAWGVRRHERIARHAGC
jgi:hypothetical protein